MTKEEIIEELEAIKSVYMSREFHEQRLMRSEIEALNEAIKAVELEREREVNKS